MQLLASTSIVSRGGSAVRPTSGNTVHLTAEGEFSRRSAPINSSVRQRTEDMLDLADDGVVTDEIEQ